MKQSELAYCANRAGVLRGKIRWAKRATNAQSTAIIEDAIAIAEDIVSRLREQLPTGGDDGAR